MCIDQVNRYYMRDAAQAANQRNKDKWTLHKLHKTACQKTQLHFIIIPYFTTILILAFLWIPYGNTQWPKNASHPNYTLLTLNQTKKVQNLSKKLM